MQKLYNHEDCTAHYANVLSYTKGRAEHTGIVATLALAEHYHCSYSIQ